jgi:Flp pilus assembly protein TadD, contains TPR repeats
MSRFLTFVFILVSSFSLQAQVATLTNAILYYGDGNLVKAKEEIDKACINEKTIALPKTWFYTGVIYKDIYQASTAEGQIINEAALVKSTEALQKVFELEKPAAEFSKKSKEALDQIWAISINRGVALYGEAKYNPSIVEFERAQSIKPADTTAYVYGIYAANELKNSELLEKYVSKLIALNYTSAAVYYIQIDALMNKNMLDSALVSSNKAVLKYPTDISLKTQQTELYVKLNKTQEAIANLKFLSDKNPNDIQLLMNIGSQYSNLNDVENAELYFQKVVALDSTNYIANFNMAVYSLKKAQVTADKIIAYDNAQKKISKMYVPNPSTDPLRIELRKQLDVAKKQNTRAAAKIGSDAEKKKNIDAVFSNIKSYEDQFLK